MRNFSIYSLIVMIVSAMITWNVIAMPMTKVHVLENLSPEEAGIAQKILNKKGYRLSEQPLFNESKDAIVITKAIGNESEPASIQLEVLHQEGRKSIPKAIFNLKLETSNVVEVMEKLPTPEQLKSIPVAFQN